MMRRSYGEFKLSRDQSFYSNRPDPSGRDHFISFELSRDQSLYWSASPHLAHIMSSSQYRSTSAPHSDEVLQKRYKDIMGKLASNFERTADRIQLDRSLDEIANDNRSKADMESICLRLESQEPIAMSTIYYDKNGIPIFAYLGCRRKQGSHVNVYFCARPSMFLQLTSCATRSHWRNSTREGRRMMWRL